MRAESDVKSSVQAYDETSHANDIALLLLSNHVCSKPTIRLPDIPPVPGENLTIIG